MLNKNWKYFIPLVIVFAGIVYLQMTAPKPINWSKTFLRKDKIPFGSAALYDVLEKTAFKDRIRTNRQNIYQSYNDEIIEGQKSSTLLLMIN